MKNWYEYFLDVKNCYMYQIVTYYDLKNWNRHFRWAVFRHVNFAHECYMYIIFYSVRIFQKRENIGMEFVTYWYQSFTNCEDLVQIKVQQCPDVILAKKGRTMTPKEHIKN